MTISTFEDQLSHMNLYIKIVDNYQDINLMIPATQYTCILHSYQELTLRALDTTCHVRLQSP